MFHWMKPSSGGSEDASKAQMLRGIVTEKLATAAQEILAVVERTVAGYEEEAAGFRQEIERQRKQLELLQPRVKLDGRVKAPDLQRDDVVLVREQEEEEEDKQQTQQQLEGDTKSLGLHLWLDDDDEGVCEDTGSRVPSVEPATSSRLKREDKKDPDYQIPSRAFLHRGPSERRRPGRPRIINTQNHLDLRIRILDSRTDILSKSVFKKFPKHQLQCPRGLQEADFLDLLRSTFPQLAHGRPFAVFTSDRSRRLQPLKLQTLTAEEISRSIRSIGAGNSALYIRLKGNDSVSGSEGAADDGTSSSNTASADESQANREKRKRGRPRLEEPDHYSFKMFMLEASAQDAASNDVVSVKSPLREVKCPRGLPEADFLDLLRSTFPQLAGSNRPLDIFRADRGRRLQKVRVKTLAPEEIYNVLRASGAWNAALYVQVKMKDEEEEVEPRLLPTTDGAADDSIMDTVEMENDDVRLRSSDSAQDADGTGVLVLPSSSASQQPDVEEEQVAAGDGDDDWKPEPELELLKRRGPRYLVVERSRTPCKVCGVWYRILGSLIKHAWTHVDEARCVCGVCGDDFPSVEELKEHLKRHQKTHDCSFCGKTFSTVNALHRHTTLHTGNRPFSCDVCHKTFAYMSSLSVHRWVHEEDKPHKCDVCQKAFGLKAQLRAHGKTHAGRDKYLCNICGKAFVDVRSMTRHRASHSGERRYGCEVCGKRFKLPGTLRSHGKIHTVRERPFLCDICCKTFVSNCGLTAHMKTHSSARPFVCAVCSKGFISKGELRLHMRVHSGEAPYGCSQCGRFFKRKTYLNNHIRSHLGIKRFVCSVCGKACSRQEHLTVHMRTHNGERPYKCTLCDKAFTQGHCLKSHMRSHQPEEPPLPKERCLETD